MARKKEEINPICGQNLRKLLSDHKMAQKDLAKILNYTEQHLSLIINGSRRLTVETARKIAAIFPGTRYEWLMGYDNFRSNDEVISAAVNNIYKEAETRREFTEYVFDLCGYKVKYFPKEEEFPGIVLDNNCYGIIKNNLVIAYMSVQECSQLVHEITNYAKYLVNNAVDRYKIRVDVPFELPKVDTEEKENG